MPDAAFFISHGSKVQGPISQAEIRQKLAKGDLAFTDYIWVNDEDTWRMLANFFAKDYPMPLEPPAGVKPGKHVLREFKAASFSQDLGISNEAIWFLYKDKSKFGPYRFLDIVGLLQKNLCTREDFVWKPGFDDWQKLKATADFAPEILSKMAHMKDFSRENIFVQRRFPRVPYDAEVIIHDDRRVVFGAATKLSEGGAFLEVPQASHEKGDRLKLHFTPGGVQIPFNCVAEVLQVQKGNPSGYAVKFIYLEEEDRKRIAEYAQAKSG